MANTWRNQLPSILIAIFFCVFLIALDKGDVLFLDVGQVAPDVDRIRDVADAYGVLSWVVPIGLGFMGSFLLVYFITRNKKATFILSGIVFTAYFAIDAGVAYWLAIGITVFVSMIIFNRFGIVAFIACWYFSYSISVLLLSFDAASIMFPSTVATLVISLASRGMPHTTPSAGRRCLAGSRCWEIDCEV